MFIPLHDTNDLKYIRLQWVTWSLIALNAIVWGITELAGAYSEFTTATVLGLGFIPSVVNDIAELPPSLVLVPENATYVTYSFLHGDLLHLGSNMIFLWVFGDNVEDALGHIKFLIFYFACAAAGALAHGLMLPTSDSPLIGASGAVAGIVTAYLMLHPKVRIWVLVLGRIPLPLPAFIPLLIWVVFQFYMLVTDIDGDVSWAAHVGGMIAGAALVLVFRRSGVPLFDRRIDSPKAVVHKTTKPEPVNAASPASPPKWGR
ncbi:membrane associated rhomboid family serine protease [Hoeflea halophila]|uniref:Membrane associated rhomboid family serine protease n=1 Tax=Hoeflea halophila TaxID=714899 RepID=A0A286I948_9HYPH|nr:rhomboid family intramembrane serine protease [Hoeflea halophila]SOE16635.1 membrane associated rhomboid family serine protease [Hoeflea halophila]